MIDSKDLIIGNYFYDEDKKILEVKEIQESLLVSHNGDWKHYSKIMDCDPIPLTEEWLLKFGFEKIKNETYINGYQYLLQVSNDYTDEEMIINRDGTWFDAIGGIDYERTKVLHVNTLCRGNHVCNTVSTVHQLQNLYYSLTGNKLEIKC